MAPETNQDIARYKANLRSEVDGAALYRGLAAATQDPQRSAVLIELALSEERHAQRWRRKLEEAGANVPPSQPSLRVRVLCWFARHVGVRAILPIASRNEQAGVASYAQQQDARDLAYEERTHARIFAEMSRSASGADIVRRETWHRGAAGGSLRAAIFGVNDGLCSNLSLVMGVAGANPGGSFVLLAGVAGLLAGAFSMAAGEYVSMRAQRELFERQLAMEKEELETSPEEERHELALIYRAKGLPKEDAERLAKLLLSDKSAGLDTLAREELGLDPEELGSPWGAAGSSFIAFAVGAVVPVLPFFFTAGTTAVVETAASSAIALLIVGAALSLFTGRNPIISGLRMLLIGWAAAGVTHLIGRLIGVSVAG